VEEQLLIEGCIRGETAARKKLYELHAPAMMSVCQRYVRCRETARDLLQDGFVKLYTKIHTYAGTGSFNGWMRKVFVTTALEHLRQNRAMQYSEISEYRETKHDASAFEHLSANELFECVANLPEIYRTVFNMHAIEGYTHVEIAKELEISDSTVRSRYAKAREMLQEMVGE
jgi:RNA polymerase sigma-70 factor (ECF subfamily)